MIVIDLIKRFSSIEFGPKYTDHELFDKLKECLEKVNQDGMMVLNDFSYFHNYINEGIRSQKTELRFYYVFLLIQLSILSLIFISGFLSGVLNLLVISILLLLQVPFFWAISANEKQTVFLSKIRSWSVSFYDDIDLTNFLSIESFRDFSIQAPFDEKTYAKLWLKEMSTSMDHDWEGINIELLPNEELLVPKIRVTLGGVRKSILSPSEYGFANEDNSIPNTLLITLLLFSRKKSIRFFGLDHERESINKRIDELNNHFELLFGKRKLPPITYNNQENHWTSKINIVDRSSTERNEIRQSLNVFLKIVNSYVGYNAI